MLKQRLLHLLVFALTIATKSSGATNKCHSSYAVIGPDNWDGEMTSPKDGNNRQCTNQAAHVFTIEPGPPSTAIRLHLEHIDLDGKDSSLSISFIFDGRSVGIERLSEDQAIINDVVTPERYGMELIFHSDYFAARFIRFYGTDVDFYVLDSTIYKECLANEENCTCPSALYSVKDAVQNISSPNYPNPSFCSNVNCYYVIQAQGNAAVQLTLLDANLGKDTVTIREHATLPGDEIARWTGKLESIIPKQVISRGRGMIVVFSSFSNTQQRGFLAQIQIVNSTCVCPNSVFDVGPGQTGTITSPTYPQMYCPGFNCTYYFSTDEGYVIQHEFHDFYTEDCTDKLSIYDTSRSDNWELIHFCDQISPDHYFTTSTKQTAIRFVTGSKNSNARFNITYRAMEYNQACRCRGGQPRAISFIELKIAFLHILYCRFVDCIYEFRVPSLAVQQISINFSLDAPHPYAVFYIYQGLPSGNMQLYDSYRDNDPVGHNVTVYSNVTIHYHIESQTPIHPFLLYTVFGFRLSFFWPECNCGTTDLLYAKSTVQYLLSPDYLKGYCNGLACVWIITAPEGKDVFIDVKEMNLEHFDYLSIFCGTNITGEIPVEMLSGNYTSRRIFSCHEALTVHLACYEGTMLNNTFKIEYKVLSENENIGWLMTTEKFDTLIDKKIDPCDNFYEFACGKFQTNKETNTERLHNYNRLQRKLKKDLVKSFEQLRMNSSSPNALKQLKKAYTTCTMDRTSKAQIIEEAINWLNVTTGALPHLIYQNETQDWDTHRLAGVMAAHGFQLLMEIGIMPLWHHHEPVYKIIWFDQGQRVIPLVSREGNLTSVEDKRNQLYDQALKLASMVNIREGMNETMLESDISSVMMIDEILAYGGDKGSSHREIHAQEYNLYSLDEAKYYWPHIRWESLITGYVGEEIKAKISDRPICIRNPRYFDALNELSSGMLGRHLPNYLFSQMLDKLSNHFSEFWFSISTSERRTPTDQEPRFNFDKEETCAVQLNQLLHIAASRAYIDFMSPSTANATERIKEIGNYIIASFHKIVSQVTWMTEYSKQQAHTKLDKLKSIIAYPDWLLKDRILDDLYPIEKIDISDNDSVTDVFIKLWDLETWTNGQYLLRETEWSFYPIAIVGAWHALEENSLSISMPTINEHTSSLPAAVIFGELGFIMAHEVGHALNTIQFDHSGLLRTWIDTETVVEFQKLKDCFIEQYSNSCYPNYDNICVNGQFTLSENLADHVGLIASYDAYKSYMYDHGTEERLEGPWANLTMEQVYFIVMAQDWCENDEDPLETRLADEHAPNKWRVVNTIRNFPTFADAFKCKTGAGMAPEHYCSAWNIESKQTTTKLQANQSAKLNGKPCFYLLLCLLLIGYS